MIFRMRREPVVCLARIGFNNDFCLIWLDARVLFEHHVIKVIGRKMCCTSSWPPNPNFQYHIKFVNGVALTRVNRSSFSASPFVGIEIASSPVSVNRTTASGHQHTGTLIYNFTPRNHSYFTDALIRSYVITCL